MRSAVRVRLNKDVFSRKIDGRVIILENNKDHIQELNEVAGFIWKLAGKPILVDEIVKKVHNKYRVSKGVAEKDVKEFVREFVNNGFLNKTAG